MSGNRLSGETFARWGAPGTALAPWWLREQHADDLVPSLVHKDHAPVWGQLGPGWAERLGDVADELDDFTISNAVMEIIRDNPDLEQSPLVPKDKSIDRLAFTQIEFRTRTFNVLRRQGLAENPDSIADLTVADALNWSYFGQVSLLDLACCIESAFVDEVREEIDEGPQIELEPWSFEISLADPRLASLGLPPLSGSLGEAVETVGSKLLIEALPDAKRQVDRLRSLNLMEAIEDLLAAAAGLDDERLQVLTLRLGFSREKPITLEAAGSQLGITRERVRQIVAEIKKTLDSVRPLYLPQLDEAVTELESAAPVALSEVNCILRNLGYGPVTVQGLVRGAEFFGRSPTIAIRQGVVLGPNHPILSSDALRKARSKAKSLARASAASNLDYLFEAMSELGVSIPNSILEIVLDGTSGLAREGEWFWLEKSSGKLATITRKILAINQPQSVRSIREALRRRLRFKAIEPVPPVHIVRKMLEDHSEFDLQDNSVFSRERIEISEAMGDLEQAMVRILKSAPGGVMTRPELMEACYDEGLNMHSVNIYTVYSPCVERVAPGVWAARGAEIDPAHVELARERLGTPIRMVRDGGWTSEGKPWFAFELNKSNFAGPVATVDPAIRAVMRGRTLQAYTRRGVDAGNIGISEDGVSAWGFTRAIHVLGAEPEDVIRTEIDLVAGSAIVSLSSPDEFE